MVDEKSVLHSELGERMLSVSESPMSVLKTVKVHAFKGS